MARVMELAISTIHGGGKRMRRGDIIEARFPSMGLGRLEMSRFVWLRISVDEALADSLIQNTETSKRRYFIPFQHLQMVWRHAGGSDWDPARLMDPEDDYQPFLPVDKYGLFVSQNPIVVDGEGLIFDRLTGLPAGA